MRPDIWANFEQEARQEVLNAKRALERAKALTGMYGETIEAMLEGMPDTARWELQIEEGMAEGMTSIASIEARAEKATDATADVLLAAARDPSTRGIVLTQNPNIRLREVLTAGAKRIDTKSSRLRALEGEIERMRADMKTAQVIMRNRATDIAAANAQIERMKRVVEAARRCVLHRAGCDWLKPPPYSGPPHKCNCGAQELIDALAALAGPLRLRSG